MGTKTVLDAVNDTLKRARVISSQNNELGTLTNAQFQIDIDVCLQIIPEEVEELYSVSALSFPNEVEDTASIALVADDRDYALPADLVALRWPLMDHTNGRVISEAAGGYEQIRRDQLIPDNFKGVPTLAAIRPSDGQLYLNRVPTTEEVGLVYNFIYDKAFSLSAATDTFPFNDTVYNAMVGVWSEAYRRDTQNSFDNAKFRRSMGRAARLMRQMPPRSSYMPRRIGKNITDPMVRNNDPDIISPFA